MDSSVFDQNRISRWFSKSSVRMLTLASITVAILAILHVSQQQANTPMQQLLQGCKLQSRDLHRMQIAFGQAGLNDFKVEKGIIWVPQARHSSYLAAANEHDAIPAELKLTKDPSESDSGNPFLSRSQQEYRKHLRRKNQIREMVIRLPFVDQAWFEMDQAPRQNAFSTSRRSAVLSIRSTPESPLREAHVDTIKQMVAGAVSDLPVENIVVIDLNNGLAHQDNTDQLTQKQRELQQIAANQKRFYENRAEELLQDFPGVKVRVDVAVNEVEVEIKRPIISATAPVYRRPTSPTAGANGVVSIEIEPRDQPPTIVQASTEAQTTVQLNKQYHVFVEVPADTVFAALGKPTFGPNKVTDRARKASIEHQTKAKFEKLKGTIVDRLLPLFPSDTGAGSSLAEHGNSLDFKLLPTATKAKAVTDWTSRAQAFWETNWPSICVLGIGAVLLTLVVRRSDQYQAPAGDQLAVAEYGDVDLVCSELSVPSESEVGRATHGDSTEIQSDANAEVQLTKLIQEDPDSAAKIIETWIRDAA